jgi:hypothetical protein
VTLGQPRKPNPLLLKLRFPTEYGLFLAANLLDLFITLLVLKPENAGRNAVAEWFASWGGRAAFIAFKIALMLVVIALCEVVAKRRAVLARILLWVAIAVMGFLAVTAALDYWRFMQTRL